MKYTAERDVNRLREIDSGMDALNKQIAAALILRGRLICERGNLIKRLKEMLRKELYPLAEMLRKFP